MKVIGGVHCQQLEGTMCGSHGVALTPWVYHAADEGAALKPTVWCSGWEGLSMMDVSLANIFLSPTSSSMESSWQSITELALQINLLSLFLPPPHLTPTIPQVEISTQILTHFKLRIQVETLIYLLYISNPWAKRKPTWFGLYLIYSAHTLLS